MRWSGKRTTAATSEAGTCGHGKQGRGGWVGGQSCATADGPAGSAHGIGALAGLSAPAMELAPSCHCNGCCRTYLTYAELCADYESGALHPADLKPALAKHINTILQPVRGRAARGRAASRRAFRHVCWVRRHSTGWPRICV